MTQAETELIRRFTAEHAWRLILSNDPDDEVQGLRSRTVDQAIFDDERRQWANWHQQQTEAEREFEERKKHNTVCRLFQCGRSRR